LADISLSLESYDGPAASRAEEARLVERLRLGEEAAYEELIERFQHPVFNLVSRLMSEPADANDVVQEVFIKIFRNVRSFRSQSSLKTWIYRIAVNEAYNHRRWFSRHRKQEIGLERDEKDQGYQDTLSDPGRSPFDLAAGQEMHEMIEQTLAGLNPTFRTAVILRDVEDLSYEEIADILQIHLGTVKSRIMRGREALRNALLARMAETAPEKGSAFRWLPQTME
jgi:RNA polymerase sigma-70 factor (ECF subfamily)